MSQGDLFWRQFVQRENSIYHPTYDQELAFYETIKEGDVESLEKKNDWDSINMPERGLLSKDPIRNLRYHMIVSIAMITRFCIEGGLNEQEAYTLSDSYINQIDVVGDEKGLKRLHRDLCFDYAGRMRELRRVNHPVSIHCMKAIDYVYNHLQEPISLQELADEIKVNVTHISKLFHKEMGQTLGSFIREQKINAAKNMLLYSEYSCAEVAQYFAFASNSHFTKVFKELTGLTPTQYRNKKYRNHWNA